MPAVLSRLSPIRSRLALRLGTVAAIGLAAVLFFAACAFVMQLAGLWLAWDALGEGLGFLAFAWGLLALLSGAFFVIALHLLWVPLPPPSGILLPRAAADSFYRLIDRIGGRLGAGEIHGVWITGEMNAAVVQRASWGGFGPIRTHLLVGLPLAHSLSRHQLAAVLAHEFSHLALQRRGAGAWLAHFRAWWLRVLERACLVCPVAAPSLDVTFRRYYRDMVRLSRLEEFEADAMAAEMVGSAVLGQTLVEVTLKERFLSQDYWPMVMAHGAAQNQPSIRPYREMGLGVAAGFLRPVAARMTAMALVDSERDGDFLHPTLAERLRALGVGAEVAAEDMPSAASHYFAPLLPSLAWVFDRAWWQDMRRMLRGERKGRAVREDGEA